nr:hypothetical protein [Bacteroidota bacterium]
MKKAPYVTLSLTMLLLSLQGQIISDFSNNADNWHSEGDGAYYWESDAGNPGGCLRVDDDATGGMNYAYAP